MYRRAINNKIIINNNNNNISNNKKKKQSVSTRKINLNKQENPTVVWSCIIEPHTLLGTSLSSFCY